MIPADAWNLIRKISEEGDGWEAEECRSFLEQDSADALEQANTNWTTQARHGHRQRGELAGSVVAGVIRPEGAAE